jgi:protein-tyrosine-phosphatase
LYRLACEDEVSMPEVDYKVGIKSRWLLGDLDHLLLRLFKSDAQLCLPPGSPTKLKTLTDFCHLIQRNTRYEVNRLDDLKPFYYELRQYLTHLLLPTRRGAGKFHSYAGRLVEAAQFTRRWLKSATLRFGLKSRKIYMPPPHTVSSVLFVCKGNICRSPFAASYVRAKLKEHNWAVEVFSAGLESSPGGKANPLAIDVALQHHISLAAHVTKPISDDLVRHADLIVVMELAQYADVVQKYPTARHKVFRLGEFHPGLAREIWDPYGGTHADFEFCFRMIRQCCDNLMGALGTE